MSFKISIPSHSRIINTFVNIYEFVNTIDLISGEFIFEFVKYLFKECRNKVCLISINGHKIFLLLNKMM